MKKLLVILFIAFFKTVPCAISCDKDHKLNLIDSARRVYDINLTHNSLTNGLDFLACDIFKDTLYMINKDKLIKISLKTGNISTNLKINSILSKGSKAKIYANQISVGESGYYLSFITELDLVSPNAKIIKVYHRPYMINDFAVLDNGIIMASESSVIEFVDKLSGKDLSKISYDLGSAGFIRSRSGLAYEGAYEDKIAEFKVDLASNNVKTKLYAPIGLIKNIKEPIVTYADNKFFFVIPYSNRSNLYIIKKEDNKVYKQILLKGSNNCTPSDDIIGQEEGTPNFNIIFYNGKYYIIALVNNNLKVLTFSI